MNETIINEQYLTIIQYIQMKRLKDALAVLAEFIPENSNWELRSRLDQIETSYKFMLDYMKKDMVDPDRNKLYNKLLVDTMQLADLANVEKRNFVSVRQYYTIKRNNKSVSLHNLLRELESYTDNMAITELVNNKEELHPDVLRSRHEHSLKELFESTWTNSLWAKQEENEANLYLNSLLIGKQDLCLFVSSVTLSLMECFDIRKVLFLFDAYKHSSIEVNQRALVGIAIIFHIYHSRLKFYPEIAARLQLLNEDSVFSDGLNRIQLQLLRTKETEKIDKKMREEIIPEMLKNVNHLRNTQFGFNEADEEKDDFNPDWQEAIEQSALGDKIREINELQMEGADIYMSTFAHLKSYPFFREIGNWFYPFDKNHSSVVQEMQGMSDKSVMNLILHSAFFCDSDKYSLCFTMMYIPKQQREAMISQLISEQEMNDIQNEHKLKSVEDFSRQPEMISNQYIQNLYRFFKLYSRRHEYRDIFKESIDLHTYPLLEVILNRPDYLGNLANYNFKKGYFSKASEIYEKLIDSFEPTSELYQKLGYCYQKEKLYTNAINAYKRSDVLKPDNLWTNRHLATCYRMTGNYNEALDYYRKVEEVQPENKTIAFYMGSCYAGMEKYEEALNCFFKIDLSDPLNVKNQRAIAWCSFLSGKYDQALKYYNRIIEKQPASLDYLNMGHVLYVNKNTAKAFDSYSKALALSSTKDEFLDYFNKDRNILIKHGIAEEDIPLILDII